MSDKDGRVAAIDSAIERAGGILRFCAAMGVTHQAVYSWKRRGWAPLDRALAMEAIFGVPRFDTMNPDIARAVETPADPS